MNRNEKSEEKFAQLFDRGAGAANATNPNFHNIFNRSLLGKSSIKAARTTRWVITATTDSRFQ